MLAELLATLLGRRRRPQPVVAPEPPPAPVAPPPPAPTLTDMLRTLIEDLGGPQLELDRDQWLDLAERVAKVAESMPPPPSFPRIATQLLVMPRDPNVAGHTYVALVQHN